MNTVDDKPAGRIHPFDALATIGCIYLALVTAGFAAFRYLAVLPTGASRNQDQTFFASANIVSLTGLPHTNAAIQNYPTLGLILVALLALGSALTSLIGGGYLLARVVRWEVSLARITAWSLAIVLLPALGLIWLGGFDAVSGSVGLGLSSQRSLEKLALVLVVALSALGLLGPLPLRELFSRRAAGDRSGYLGLTLAAVALLVIVGAMVLMLCGAPITASATQSLALRAFGGGGVRVDVTSAMPWAVACLAILGAAPASTAGGLSVLPLVVLARGAADAMRSRVIDPLVGVAVAWMFLFAVCAAASVITLAALAPSLPADRVLLLSFAALGNVSVSHESLGITGNSLFVLSAAMLIGRLLPLVMLAWMAVVAERKRAA